MPVMVEAPCLDISVDDIASCVYPNPPSYSEAMMTSSPHHDNEDDMMMDDTPPQSPSSLDHSNTSSSFFSNSSPVRSSSLTPLPTANSTELQTYNHHHQIDDDDVVMTSSPSTSSSLLRSTSAVFTRVGRALNRIRFSGGSRNNNTYFTDDDGEFSQLNQLITNDEEGESWPPHELQEDPLSSNT